MAVTPQDSEKRKRIFIALWAYAYEVENDPLVPDGVYDSVSHSIDVSIPTDNPEMDEWFKKNFVADTGQWIHIHPGIKRLREIYKHIAKGDKR